ncbi:MAG: DUF2157 domain-containing protein, partial [Victivallales bacterium]
NTKWLMQEVERWINDGIIDRSQADRITALYPEETPSRNWGPLIFSVIGAIVFGLGVILLFAYNWDSIHKFAKLALIFSALLGTHGAGYYFRSKGASRAYLSEAFFALGTMFFGSGIWLVSQIYNIDEHYPNAFIVWGVGALLLAWGLPSIVQGVMASVLLVLWGAFENFGFDSRTNIAPLLILAGILPLAWRMRSRILLAVAIPSFVLSLLFNCHYFFEHVAPALFISVAALLTALSIIVRRKNLFSESSAVFAVYGSILYWISLYVFTFPNADRHIFRSYWFDEVNSSVYVLVTASAAIVAWLLAILPVGKIKDDLNKFYHVDHFAIPVTVFAVTLNFGWLSGFDGWGGAAVFNIVFLFQSVMLISYGCRSVNSKLTAAGTILLAFLAFARYADLFDSLLVRAVVFLAVGAGIFLVGMRYSRRKKEATGVKQ